MRWQVKVKLICCKRNLIWAHKMWIPIHDWKSNRNISIIPWKTTSTHFNFLSMILDSNGITRFSKHVLVEKKILHIHSPRPDMYLFRITVMLVVTVFAKNTRGLNGQTFLEKIPLGLYICWKTKLFYLKFYSVLIM